MEGTPQAPVGVALLFEVAHSKDSLAFCALHPQRTMAEHCPYLWAEGIAF